jgi:hypothetical protein
VHKKGVSFCDLYVCTDTYVFMSCPLFFCTVNKPAFLFRINSKLCPRTGRECPDEECVYSSTLSLTSALDGMGVQNHARAALPPGKTRYLLYRRLGGPQGRLGRVRKISSPPAFDPRTFQPLASHYTNWAIPAHIQIARYDLNTYRPCGVPDN